MDVGDLGNPFLVVARADGSLLIGNAPRTVISRDEALLLAAWLVVMADPAGDRFGPVLKAVQRS